MNERIKQLARQAGLEWKTQQPHYTNTDNPIDFPESANRDLEKFALLIVRECAEIADKGWAASSVQIKQHFGIEE
jgi:hypothetical protein